MTCLIIVHHIYKGLNLPKITNLIGELAWAWHRSAQACFSYCKLAWPQLASATTTTCQSNLTSNASLGQVCYYNCVCLQCNCQTSVLSLKTWSWLCFTPVTTTTRRTRTRTRTRTPHQISQLLLTRFWPNFKRRHLRTSRTDSNCYSDICQRNICPGDIYFHIRNISDVTCSILTKL